MTIPALSGPRSAHLVAHAMDAAGIIFAFLLMTAGAVRRWHIFVVLHLLDAIVTINTVERTMHRFGVAIGRKQRHCLRMAIDHALVSRVGMTIKTISVFQLLRRKHPRRCQ